MRQMVHEFRQFCDGDDPSVESPFFETSMLAGRAPMMTKSSSRR
jgi:hypothetical protein